MVEQRTERRPSAIDLWSSGTLIHARGKGGELKQTAQLSGSVHHSEVYTPGVYSQEKHMSRVPKAGTRIIVPDWKSTCPSASEQAHKMWPHHAVSGSKERKWPGNPEGVTAHQRRHIQRLMRMTPHTQRDQAALRGRKIKGGET